MISLIKKAKNVQIREKERIVKIALLLKISLETRTKKTRNRMRITRQMIFRLKSW